MQTPCSQAVSREVGAWVQVESETVKARSPLGSSARLDNASLHTSSMAGDSQTVQLQRSAYDRSEGNGEEAEEDSRTGAVQNSPVQDMAVRYPAQEEKTAGSMQPLNMPGANPDSPGGSHAFKLDSAKESV